MAPKLSLCMIVRDNEQIIEPCLQSIRPWVDELIVVDTGSKDKTPDIARRLGAEVSFFPWCDSFATARNESLRLAHGEWLFWMDSDDTISEECGRQLRTLVDGAHAANTLGYIMQVHCPGATAAEGVTVVDHVKLIRNRPDLRFEGRIHEQLLPAIRRANGAVAWTDIFVTHSGSDHSIAGRKRKFTRDLRLLDLELLDHPEHPFCLFNLGMTYLEMGETEQATAWLRRCIAASKPEESHLRKAYALLLGALANSAQWEVARSTLDEALRLFPDDPELAFRQGIILHALKQPNEAIAGYRRALRGPQERYFSSLDPGICGYKARHNLALVYRESGQLDWAELQLRLALEERPAYRPSMLALGEVLLAQGKLTTAELLCQAWRASSNTRVVGVLVQADLQAARGHTEAALDSIAQAVHEFPEDETLRQTHCQRLFELQCWKEARTALEDLITRQPDDGAAHHNLALVLLQLDDQPGAIEALRRSLQARPDSAGTQSLLQQLERSANANLVGTQA